MDDEQLSRDWGNDYSPKPTQDTDWEQWASTVELRLSKQGAFSIGLGVGLLVALGLIGLQGKVTLNLVKSHGSVVEALNQGSTSRQVTSKVAERPREEQAFPEAPANNRVSYSAPSGKVTEAPKPDETELAELNALMEEAAIEQSLQKKDLN